MLTAILANIKRNYIRDGLSLDRLSVQLEQGVSGLRLHSKRQCYWGFDAGGVGSASAPLEPIAGEGSGFRELSTSGGRLSARETSVVTCQSW